MDSQHQLIASLYHVPCSASSREKTAVIEMVRLCCCPVLAVPWGSSDRRLEASSACQAADVPASSVCLASTRIVHHVPYSASRGE